MEDINIATIVGIVGAASTIIGALSSALYSRMQAIIDKKESVSGEINEFVLVNKITLDLVDRLSTRVESLEEQRDLWEKEKKELRTEWEKERKGLRKLLDECLEKVRNNKIIKEEDNYVSDK